MIDLIKFDENFYSEENIKLISGSDEVGRGAMAGPIVVCSLILKRDYKNHRIKDSKLLSPKVREELYDEIIENALDYSISSFDNNQVDELNPKQASKLGMVESILNLKFKPDICLIDGENIEIKNYDCRQIIKGDLKSQSIAAASIIAKVTRDRKMIEFSKKFPNYEFQKHKGYCTKKHIQLVEKNGVLSIHRKTYKPIKELLK